MLTFSITKPIKQVYLLSFHQVKLRPFVSICNEVYKCLDEEVICQYDSRCINAITSSFFHSKYCTGYIVKALGLKGVLPYWQRGFGDVTIVIVQNRTIAPLVHPYELWRHPNWAISPVNVPLHPSLRHGSIFPKATSNLFKKPIFQNFEERSLKIINFPAKVIHRNGYVFWISSSILQPNQN